MQDSSGEGICIISSALSLRLWGNAILTPPRSAKV